MLRAAIPRSVQPSRHHGAWYQFWTANGNVELLIPAPEYYTFGLNFLAQKYTAALRSLSKLRRLEEEIQQSFQATRIRMPATGQPSFRLREQVSELKAELGDLLFVTRNFLETLAPLAYFLYGPDCPRFDGFIDIVNKLEEGTIDDPPLIEFNRNRLGWFYELRDLRDFVTHGSDIDVSFFYSDAGGLRTLLVNRFELRPLCEDVDLGIRSVCTFWDGHFSARLVAAPS